MKEKLIILKDYIFVKKCTVAKKEVKVKRGFGHLEGEEVKHYSEIVGIGERLKIPTCGSETAIPRGTYL